MTRYVLDTDILTRYAEGHEAVGRRVRERSSDQIAITVLTVEEHLSGWNTQVRGRWAMPPAVKCYTAANAR